MSDNANGYSYFQVDGSEFSNDIHIALSKFSGHSDEKWEIVIGGWSGAQSVIRHRDASSKLTLVTENHSKTYFNSMRGDIRVFVTDGELTVRDGSDIFMQYQDSLIVKSELKYLLVSGGWGGHGTYKIFGFPTGGRLTFSKVLYTKLYY